MVARHYESVAVRKTGDAGRASGLSARSICQTQSLAEYRSSGPASVPSTAITRNERKLVRIHLAPPFSPSVFALIGESLQKGACVRVHACTWTQIRLQSLCFAPARFDRARPWARRPSPQVQVPVVALERPVESLSGPAAEFLRDEPAQADAVVY